MPIGQEDEITPIFESRSLDCHVWYTMYERYRRPSAIIVSRAAAQQQHSSSRATAAAEADRVVKALRRGQVRDAEGEPDRVVKALRRGEVRDAEEGEQRQASGGVYPQQRGLRVRSSSSTRKADHLSTSKRKAPVPTLTQQQQQQQQQEQQRQTRQPQQQQQQETADQAARALR